MPISFMLDKSGRGDSDGDQVVAVGPPGGRFWALSSASSDEGEEEEAFPGSLSWKFFAVLVPNAGTVAVEELGQQEDAKEGREEETSALGVHDAACRAVFVISGISCAWI